MDEPLVLLREEKYFHYKGSRYKRVDTGETIKWYKYSDMTWYQLNELEHDNMEDIWQVR